MRVTVFSAVLLAAAVTTGCGAKTGLDAPDLRHDGGLDARGDAALDGPLDAAPDAPRRPARCFPLRIRTRVGFVVSMTPDADARATTGYRWALQSVPEGSRAANYAFDVTPARLVTGLITERGVLGANRAALASAFPERAALPERAAGD